MHSQTRTMHAVSLLAITATARAQPIFCGLAPPPSSYLHSLAISADGSTVTGFLWAVGAGQRLFRWRDGVVENLGALPGATNANGYALSSDGSVITGGSAGHAIRWTAATAIVDLGTLPGATGSGASAISADGTVIAGQSTGSAGTRAMLWTQGTGMEDLGVLSGGTWSGCTGLSADGLIAAGSSEVPGGARAFRWTRAAGLQPLGTLPGWEQARSYALSADGSTLVGNVELNGASVAVRWVGSAGPFVIGPTSGDSLAKSVNADGSVVGGITWSAEVGGRAMIWTAASGPLDLNIHLRRLGVDLDGWILSDVVGISADGLTLAGNDYETGGVRAWIARLPRLPSCYANCDDSTNTPVLNVNDFICFLMRFAAGDPAANCDGSTSVPILNVNDFTCFLSGFAAGCP